MRGKPLRRIVLSTVGTVSGVVLLLALKPSALPTPSTRTAVPVGRFTAALSPSEAFPSSEMPDFSGVSDASEPVDSSKPLTLSALKSSRQPSTAPSRRPSPTRKAGTPRTVTGHTVRTGSGPVQVRITLSVTWITAVSVVRTPAATPRSQELSSAVIPQLIQQTLAAQSADIDAVSGATYTSQGYMASLQSALDRAGV